MTESNTQGNDASVDKFLAGIKDEQKRSDCLNVLKLMKELIMKAYNSPAIAGAIID